MTKQEMALMIPILALSIPVVAIIFSSLVKVARFKAEAQQRSFAHPETEGRVLQLEEDVAILRRELSETQERLDFTERLLAQRSEVDRR